MQADFSISDISNSDDRLWTALDAAIEARDFAIGVAMLAGLSPADVAIFWHVFREEARKFPAAAPAAPASLAAVAGSARALADGSAFYEGRILALREDARAPSSDA
jgi:hypothetical protein